MRSMPKTLCPLRRFHVTNLKDGNDSFEPSMHRMQHLKVTKPEEQYKIPKKISKKIYTHKEAPRPKRRGAVARVLNTKSNFCS